MEIQWNKQKKNYYMARQIVVGIDIGTSETRVIVAEVIIQNGRITPKIIGTGTSESRGVYRGYVADQTEATKSVRLAVSRAEKVAGIKIKRAYVSFGGIGLGSVVSNGSVVISKADLEITNRDMATALEAAESGISPATIMNKRIINTVPIEYKIDGKVVWGQAVGLKAERLEVKALFITCLEHHLSDLINTVEEAGVEVVDVLAASVALSFVTLSKKQKRVGCLLVDMGAETLSVVVFENSNLISLEVFPIGGNDLTNDIALGLKVSLENAENIKIDLDRGTHPAKKKLEEIVSKRLRYCFGLIETHLKSIGRDALLPAGAIISGGSANITGIKSISENSLKLPSQLAEVYFGSSTEGKVRDRSWAVACGLALVGFNADNEKNSIGIRNGKPLAERSKHWRRLISRWISQFLP